MAPRGSIIRTLQAIQIGSTKAMQAREARNRELGLNEIDAQYQVTIEGTASTVPAFATVDLDFEYEFHHAPSQRDSDLWMPQLTVGSYIHQGGPLMVTACVVTWDENPDNGGITGANVGIGVMGSSTTPEQFGGYAHLTFQGFAISREDMEDNPDLIEGEDPTRPTD